MKDLLKKGAFCFLTGFSVLVLVACSKDTSQTTSPEATSTASSSQMMSSSASSEEQSSVSSTSTTSSSKQEEKTMNQTKATGMDLIALVNGDYSSVKGTWKDEAGHQLTFDDKGLVSKDEEFYGVSATDYGTAAGGVYGGASGGFLIEFIPAGVKISSRTDGNGTLLFADDSDTNADRIWTGIGQDSFLQAGHFYYRVNE